MNFRNSLLLLGLLAVPLACTNSEPDPRLEAAEYYLYERGITETVDGTEITTFVGHGALSDPLPEAEQEYWEHNLGIFRHIPNPGVSNPLEYVWVEQLAPWRGYPYFQLSNMKVEKIEELEILSHETEDGLKEKFLVVWSFDNIRMTDPEHRLSTEGKDGWPDWSSDPQSGTFTMELGMRDNDYVLTDVPTIFLDVVNFRVSYLDGELKDSLTAAGLRSP